MAIVINEEEKKINWAAIGVVAGILIVLVIGTYYLFFAPTPLIDAIVPPDIQKVSDISEIDIGVNRLKEVTDNPVAKTLKNYVAPPDQGNFGRENPFAAF